MKPTWCTLFILLCLSVNAALAEALYDSNRDGIAVIVDSDLTASEHPDPPEPDGNATLLIGGNPSNDYSKFYNPGYSPYGVKSDTVLLPVPPEALGQDYQLAFDVLIPPNSQIDKTTVIFQFFRDTETDYKINDVDVEGGDGAQKVQTYHYDLANLTVEKYDQWQSVSVSGKIPSVDLGDNAIQALRFSICFRQVDAAANDEPIEACVRNIVLTTTAAGK